MASWRGYIYTEAAPNSPEESYSSDNSRAVRCLQFSGSLSRSERLAVARAFLGYATLQQVPEDVAGPGVVRKYISRTTPHPYQGDSTSMYATRILRVAHIGEPGNEPGGNGDVVSRYPYVRMWIEYSTLPYDIAEDDAVRALTNTSPLYISAGAQFADEGYWLQSSWTSTRYITRTVDPSGRVTTLKQGMLRFAGTAGSAGYPDGIPTFEPIPFPEGMAVINYTWWGVPAAAFPQSTIQSSLGKINDGSFDGFSTGTLLLLSVSLKPRRDPFGQRTLDVGYKMMWMPKVGADGTVYGHNAIPWVSQSAGVGYYTVSSDGSANASMMPFRSTDFMAFFRPTQA